MKRRLIGFLKRLLTPLRRLLLDRGWQLSRTATERADARRYEASYQPETLREHRFYNIGASSFRHQYWTNVDNPSSWYSVQQSDQIPWDLLSDDPLAVDDGVAEIVYTSHTIEHVTDEAAARLFSEAYRILRPGGVLRVTAPDSRLAYDAYRRGDIDFFLPLGTTNRETSPEPSLLVPRSQASIQQLFLFSFAGSVSTIHADGAAVRLSDEDVDEVFAGGPTPAAFDRCTSMCSIDVQRRYPGNHINWFTHDKAVAMIASAGFASIEPSGYAQSAVPVLRNTTFFDSTVPHLSLYVEATK